MQIARDQPAQSFGSGFFPGSEGRPWAHEGLPLFRTATGARDSLRPPAPHLRPAGAAAPTDRVYVGGVFSFVSLLLAPPPFFNLFPAFILPGSTFSPLVGVPPRFISIYPFSTIHSLLTLASPISGPRKCFYLIGWGFNVPPTLQTPIAVLSQSSWFCFVGGNVIFHKKNAPQYQKPATSFLMPLFLESHYTKPPFQQPFQTSNTLAA